MKIKIYCNITYITYIAYITSRIALHNKSCMPMDEYSNQMPQCAQAQAQAITATTQRQQPSQQPNPDLGR